MDRSGEEKGKKQNAAPRVVMIGQAPPCRLNKRASSRLRLRSTCRPRSRSGSHGVSGCLLFGVDIAWRVYFKGKYQIRVSSSVYKTGHAQSLMVGRAATDTHFFVSCYLSTIGFVRIDARQFDCNLRIIDFTLNVTFSGLLGRILCDVL